ncbi:hypothetical protein DICVIV_10700 [Dictyocaulus viviparus]|uniref:Uncharacterized protein n=1 Tax=Dictyocaulus viviparus TaxID=29172 RepID=A0A0D8XLN4_DICVI|nr:hypothetical protein DICVIV_10700 [Dictyocaulus viviparus]
MKDVSYPNAETLPFPHFDSKYKCCCNTVHVKQGTLIIGIVCSIITTFGLFSMVFSRESTDSLLFELIYLSLDTITLVLLFVAVLKDKKIFLIPFFLNQESVISTEEIEIEKSHPEMEGTIIIRLTAAFVATTFILVFGLTSWWLFVIYKCYQYYSDMEKHREAFNTTVSYTADHRFHVY